jgi:hypothetical protein
VGEEGYVINKYCTNILIDSRDWTGKEKASKTTVLKTKTKVKSKITKKPHQDNK